MEIFGHEYLKDLQERGVRDERFRAFDPDKYDWIMEIECEDGMHLKYCNPIYGVEYSDLDHDVIDYAAVIKLGSAFWDWRNKTQQVVGLNIDFDDDGKSLAGVSRTQIKEIDAVLARVPWIEVRCSTGGEGRHLIVQFDTPIQVSSRWDSSDLGTAVKNHLSRETGYDFDNIVDCAGGPLWIYSVDADKKAFQVLKSATATLPASELPLDWLDPM